MAYGKKGFGIGKNLSNTDTCGSQGAKPPHGATSMARGARQDPPKGGSFGVGKGLSNTQTRNSIPTKR